MYNVKISIQELLTYLIISNFNFRKLAPRTQYEIQKQTHENYMLAKFIIVIQCFSGNGQQKLIKKKYLFDAQKETKLKELK